MSKYKVILLRHGEGEWNKENRFCSWVDQKLSVDGVQRPGSAAGSSPAGATTSTWCFTSLLSVPSTPPGLVLEAMRQEWVPVVKSWRAERAALRRPHRPQPGRDGPQPRRAAGEGCGGGATTSRRRPSTRPTRTDAEIYNDGGTAPADVSKEELPRAESLKQVAGPVCCSLLAPDVGPEIRRGRNVLILCPREQLQSSVEAPGKVGTTTSVVFRISDSDIANVTLPTGTPILLELDENLRSVKPRQLLGDQDKIQAAIKKVEDQGKVKPPA
ncbi:hypothetical protein CRUP_021792 [Coryphaenoides rupestris]|nr:hypothetical protein CRUP_021792 [Coryphaenoides rupestris]